TGRTADILEVLAMGGPPLTLLHLASVLDVRTGALYAPLKALVEAGKVTKLGKGGKNDPARYSLKEEAD
ncbi:MAG TPA: hypothetical protein VNM48_22770, partial [Chloroflexota bacterium]|nr:hypothetical protein [Chloroflexota bacterium]